MARTGDDAGGWPSDRKPKEPDWLEEHGAEFYFTDRGQRRFKTTLDSERWFKATHGDCLVCGGTGYEAFERGSYAFVRRCSRLPEPPDRSPQTRRTGGWTQA